jgi:hypothetical protein
MNATFKHPTSFQKKTKQLEMAMRILDDEKLFCHAVQYKGCLI